MTDRHAAFHSRLARAWHKFKIEVVGLHKLAQSPRSLGSQLTFCLANGTARLWSVEPDKTHVWLPMVNADGVSVDDVNISGIYRCGNG